MVTIFAQPRENIYRNSGIIYFHFLTLRYCIIVCFIICTLLNQLNVNGNDNVSTLQILFSFFKFFADLSKELSELGLLNRQALIVIPHHPATALNKGQPLSRNYTSSDNDVNPSNTNNEGYFGRVKRLLSYVNPLSYLGNGVGTTSSEQGSNDGLWQYSKFLYSIT